MDKATREERRDILRQIDRLEIKRCAKCVGYVPHGDPMRCKCPTAKKIRKLGDQLIAISARTRQGRMDALIKQAQDEGLTLEIYYALREAKMHHKQINRLISMTQSEYHQWRYDHGLVENAKRVHPDENKRSGKVAERKGLTVDGYLNAKKLGYLDKDIMRKYEINSWSLRKFKMVNGLYEQRGEYSENKDGVKV